MSYAPESMLPTYRYVRVGSYYINNRLPLPLLAHYLWHQSDQFLGSEGKTTLGSPRLSRLLPTEIVKVVRIAKVLSRFLFQRLKKGLRPAPADVDALMLSVPGDFAILRRSGAVKVLDIGNSVVHTIMAPHDREKLGERIQLSREASRFAFAPRVESVEIEEGCFSEEFISGSHPLNFEGCHDDFSTVYRPLLVEFLRAVAPDRRALPTYLRSLREEILARDGLLQSLDEEIRGPVVDFVNAISRRLEGLQGEIPLVLSHGDYFSGNVVIDGGRHRAIDWANMGFRSPLHDLYYLQMNHCRRVHDHAALKLRTVSAIRELREALRDEDEQRFEELAGSLTSRDEYRLLFYLECIQVPLVRCNSVDDRYLASMLVRVSWFAEYERRLSEERVGESVTTGTGNAGMLEPSGARNA